MSTLSNYIQQYKDLWSNGQCPDPETRRDLEHKISRLYQVNQTPIGGVSNYYGGLSVAKVEDSYFWAIENYDGFSPEEITKELYDALITFNTKEK